MGPNLEQLTALHASLVLSSKTWARGNQAMEQLGIRVESRDPRSISGALADTYKIGEAVGRKHAARELLKRMRARIAAAESGVRKHPKVMLILGVGHAPFTFLPNSWGGSLIRAAGGEPLTGGATSRSGFERSGRAPAPFTGRAASCAGCAGASSPGRAPSSPNGCPSQPGSACAKR